MPKIVSLTGRIAVVVAVVVCATTFESLWNVGEDGISLAVVADDSEQTSSGTEIEPRTLAAEESGNEEGGVFGVATVVTGGMAWVIYHFFCGPPSKRQPQTMQETGNATD